MKGEAKTLGARPASIIAAPGETLWQRRRRLVSLEIERIAIAEFVAHGYANVTVERIAAAAGTTVRTFYRYFTGKEDVLWAMPRRVSERLGEAVKLRPEGETILESYRQAILNGFDADADDEWISLQLGKLLENPAAGALPRLRSAPGLQNMICVIADRMGLDAERDLAPRVIGEAIGAAIMVALYKWNASQGRADRRTLLIEALDVLQSIGAAREKTKKDPVRLGRNRRIETAGERKPRTGVHSITTGGRHGKK